jgi:DNA ligase-1
LERCVNLMKITKPMLLSYGTEPFTDEKFLFEPKWDGIRLLVGEDFSYTRHSTITTNRFSELRFDIREEVLLDSELIAPGTKAPDDFEKVMSRFSGNKQQPIQFIAFVILSHRNKSVASLPIEERKGLLTKVLEKIDSPHFIPTPFALTEGETMFNVVKENNMEGMVAKRLGSKYVNNLRTNNWIKIINWRYHDAIVTKVSFKPLTAQLHNAKSEYLGSVRIGFTKEIKEEILSRTPPFSCIVKSRGCTSGGKLRHPQIIKLK